MAAAGGSNIGLRKNNEDSYYINEACGLFAIADGMGGHEHGQLASRIAVEQFANLCRGVVWKAFLLRKCVDCLPVPMRRSISSRRLCTAGLWARR